MTRYPDQTSRLGETARACVMSAVGGFVGAAIVAVAFWEAIDRGLHLPERPR